MEELMNSILQQMQRTLSSPQLKKLKRVLEESFARWTDGDGDEEADLVGEFLLSKEVEGRSPRTPQCYESTLRQTERTIGKPFTHVSTSDLREYLNGYESNRVVGKVAIDNIRRIFSSFFA